MTVREVAGFKRVCLAQARPRAIERGRQALSGSVPDQRGQHVPSPVFKYVSSPSLRRDEQSYSIDCRHRARWGPRSLASGMVAGR